MSETKSEKKKREAKKILAKFYVVLSLLVQAFRIFGTAIIFYNEIDVIVLKREALGVFDPTEYPDTVTPSEREKEANDTALEEFLNIKLKNTVVRELDKIDEEKSGDWDAQVIISLPCMEVFTSWILIYFIAGPLSKHYSCFRWIKWLLRMRIFWMRLIWTATAVVFSIIAVMYRKDMFLATGKGKYFSTPQWVAVISFICIEYFTLGILECFVKIISSETLLLKLRKSSLRLSKRWRKMYMFSYHAGMFAYVARNFSMSLYFGLLTAFVSQDDNQVNAFSGLTLVLQVYLAIIRGRFYGFFMHVFLSPFLIEEDDDMFKSVKEERAENEDNLERMAKNGVSEKTSLKKDAEHIV